MNLLAKVLVTIGSSTSIGFGIWHFFVPNLWKWYSYIDPKATELVLDIQATNIFFSLSLVLIGITNIILIYSSRSNRFSIMVMLFVSTILWVTRSVVQIIYPQGSINSFLQHGMLIAFIIVSLLYIISFVLILSQKSLMIKI